MKTINRFLALALMAVAFVSCSNDNDTVIPAPQEVDTKIVGKWKLSYNDGSKALTNAKAVWSFASNEEGTMSLSMFIPGAQRWMWLNRVPMSYLVKDNRVTITTPMVKHSIAVNYIDDSRMYLSIEKSADNTGKTDDHATAQNCIFSKVTVDYSKEILGLWEGVEMTGDETYGDAYHRIEYKDDGTYTYYSMVGDVWQPQEDMFDEWNVDGDWLATRWQNIGSEVTNYEWWDIEEIKNDTMRWSALRQKEDGTRFSTTFTWKKVDPSSDYNDPNEKFFDFTTSMPEGWTSTEAASFDSPASARGLHLSSNATLTYKNIENLRRVQITYSTDTDNNTISVAYGANEDSPYTLHKGKNLGVAFMVSSDKAADVNVKVNCAGGDVYIKNILFVIDTEEEEEYHPLGEPKAHISIAQFLEEADTETIYELTGTVERITNKKYGNFDLVENGTRIYIYGLLDEQGRPQQFSTLGIKAGDELTLKGIYTEYNGKPEIKDAQFVSVKHASDNDGNDEYDGEGQLFDFSRSIPAGWTATVNPLQYETASPSRGAQFTSSSVLTLPGVSNVSNVRIIYSGNNTENGNSINVSVGGNDWGTESVNKVTAETKDFANDPVSGDLVVTITRTAKSVWIKTIIVTCDKN